MWPINVVKASSVVSTQFGFLYYFEFKPRQFGPLLGKVKDCERESGEKKGTYQRQGRE